jgi:beta-1,4-mannosyltransferase
VTEAMRDDLANFKIKAVKMYDKPHESFHMLDAAERAAFHNKLVDVYKIDLTSGAGEDRKSALLVSSSSWTEDEDFHLLISAFESIIYSFLVNYFKNNQIWMF